MVSFLNTIGNNLDDLKGNLKISSASIKNEFETINLIHFLKKIAGKNVHRNSKHRFHRG